MGFDKTKIKGILSIGDNTVERGRILYEKRLRENLNR